MGTPTQEDTAIPMLGHTDRMSHMQATASRTTVGVQVTVPAADSARVGVSALAGDADWAEGLVVEEWDATGSPCAKVSPCRTSQ